VDLASNANLLATNIPGATLTVLPGAGHYMFLASCTTGGREMRAELCAESPSIDRDVIHGTTRELAVQFFDRTLK
jgi:predicted dienelactone hydrolase